MIYIFLHVVLELHEKSNHAGNREKKIGVYYILCIVMMEIDLGLCLECSGVYFHYLLIVGLCDAFGLYFLLLEWGIFSSLHN